MFLGKKDTILWKKLFFPLSFSSLRKIPFFFLQYGSKSLSPPRKKIASDERFALNRSKIRAIAPLKSLESLIDLSDRYRSNRSDR